MRSIKDKHVPATLAVAALSLAVGCDSDCAPRGYEEGEQFRITVLSSDVPDSAVLQPGVECSPLAIGDSFIVEAGPWRKPNTSGGCESPSTVAIDNGPPFAQGYFPYCENGGGTQLGLSCYPADNNSCEPRLVFYIGEPIIRPDDDVINDGLLVVRWYNCHGSCLENFTVRIERLLKSS